MYASIIELSQRGQITIPQKIRLQMSVKRFTCEIKNGMIVLKPLKTREEFIEELEEADKHWKKYGGLTLKQLKKKYKL